ncbi:MAG: hypothetical protein ACQ9MH_17170 [Nitrospinales bacterium]
MLGKTHKFLLQNITKIPNPIGKFLLLLNRNPNVLFGKKYRIFRKLLVVNVQFYDNRAQLLQSVNTAIRTIPYYRKRYGNRFIKSLEEFEESIPFIDKDVVLENYDSFISPEISLDDYDVCTTGGTSGRPLQLIAPKNRYIVELATMHSLWKRVGYQFDVRAVIRNNKLNKGKGHIVNPITREIIFDGFRLEVDYFDYIYRILKKYSIKFIHCYPSVA